MTPETLRVVDVQLPSPRLTSRAGIPVGSSPPTVPATAKLLPGGLPVQEMQPNLLHIGVEARIAEQVKDGDLVALPDRYGKPVETLKVIERVPWTRDTNSPHSHLARLIARPAQDEHSAADDVFTANARARQQHAKQRKIEEQHHIAALAREPREKFLKALEGLGVKDAVDALADSERAALRDELLRRDAGA